MGFLMCNRHSREEVINYEKQCLPDSHHKVPPHSLSSRSSARVRTPHDLPISVLSEHGVDQTRAGVALLAVCVSLQDYGYLVQ